MSTAKKTHKCRLSSFFLVLLSGLLLYRSGGLTTISTVNNGSNTRHNLDDARHGSDYKGQHPTEQKHQLLFSLHYRQLYKYQAPSSVRNATTTTTEECGEGPDFKEFFAQENSHKVRSRLDEDKKLYEYFFKNKTTGSESSSSSSFTYLEIGAYDGKQESNSRFFDECLGWDGLLVEANPTMYQGLVQNRPHAHRVSLAASCSMEQAERNVTVGFIDAIFTNAAQVDTVNAHAYEKRPKPPVQVPCGPLTPILLDLFDGGRVTLFSLDVEGAEPMVLQSIDFDKVFIDIFMVENYNVFCREECPSRDKFRRILESKGYERRTGKIPNSDLFVHRDSRFLADLHKLS
mmetsp:Transcript_890/g.1976  ORF Transcript_890/g.1976 Transcript_890/m.1976 type:complete len:346 (-) Transcript_890:736-1773(-)